MSNAYISQNEKLKNSFKNIISMKREIGTTKARVSQKLTELKNLHTEMIKDNNKHIFLFCLDSFYYQYKIFSMEFDHIKKLRAILNNRMYCDYYKLHNIIIKFCKEYITDDSLNIHTFPVYKDLEPFQEYRIEDILLLHESILNLINALYVETKSKGDNILHYNDNHKVGFSISNFLNTLSHENKILQEQISLFINYISFFHISQQKQLKKLHHKINDFYTEVDENINMNYTFSIDDIGDEQTRDMLLETTEDEGCFCDGVEDIKSMETTSIPLNVETNNIEPISSNNIVQRDTSAIPKFNSLSLASTTEVKSKL
jgi:hypothetical protein